MDAFNTDLHTLKTKLSCSANQASTLAEETSRPFRYFLVKERQDSRTEPDLVNQEGDRVI